MYHTTCFKCLQAFKLLPFPGFWNPFMLPDSLTHEQSVPRCHPHAFSHYLPLERRAHIIFSLSSVHGLVLWVFAECCCSPLSSSYFQKIKIHFPLFRSCLIIAYSPSPPAGINTGFSWTLISSSAGVLQQAGEDFTAPHGATQAIAHKSQGWEIVSVRCNKKQGDLCVFTECQRPSAPVDELFTLVK